METVRYVFGVIDAVLLPPAVLFWLLVHPWAGRWRRIGPTRAYVILGVAMTAVSVGLYQAHPFLLGRPLPTHWGLWLAAAVCIVASQAIEFRCRRYLDLKTLAGVPELREDQAARVLLDQGPYAVVRHPRYVGVTLGVVAYALFVHYTGIYVLTAVSILALVVVIRLEEAELERSLGERYAAYRRRVPMLVPRWPPRR